jgi:putative ABC transport system permease protein
VKTRSILGLAWTNMSRRKLRTILTTLGIIVGIMAMVSISSLSGGFEEEITGQLMEGLDADLITVMPSGGLLGSGLSYLLENESDYIATISGVAVTMPQMQRSVTLYNNENETLSTYLIGVNFDEFWEIYSHKLNFVDGELPDPPENNTGILGYTSTEFAQAGENVTAEILIRTGMGFSSKNITFIVSGVLEEAGFSGLTPLDRAFFVPLNTTKTLFDTDAIDSITVKINDPDQANDIADEIRDYYEDQVLVLVPSSIISMIQNIFTLISVFLLGIAAIALLVAGIAILNIMLVTVMERTREIGIMKALGAKNRTILGQFLSEAALLGFLGGVFGIILGWILAFAMGQFLPGLFSGGSFGEEFGMGFQSQEFTFTLVPHLSLETILITLTFAIMVSVIFAIYPARKAAKLDPVQALRYE